MRSFRSIVCLLTLLATLTFAGCASYHPDGPPMGSEQDIAELSRRIMNLGPDVDPEEARRAARVAYERTYQLSREYQITDPPLVHNTKVNMGLRPRGLCWHWAQDMETRLAQEHFETLQLHRAIANADNEILIDHSTVILSARGDSMFQGIVLDPWRQGGVLFWSPTRADTRYSWVARQEVFEQKRIKAARSRSAR